MVLAGGSLWLQRTNVAFVAATLGAVAWFLNYRTGIKESLPTADLSDDEGMDDTNET